MNLTIVKTFFLFTIIFLVLSITIAESIHAVPMEPIKIPTQAEVFINSEKNIPRLEWTAGKYLQKGLFQAAIKLSEKSPLFYYHAGMAFQKMENKSNAIDHYEKALDLLKGLPAEDFKKQIKNYIVQCR